MNGRSACAMTPAACRYWTLTFVGLGLVLIVGVGAFWTALRHRMGAALLLAAALACFANYSKNCTYHCRLTGPLFLAAGAVLIADWYGVHVVPEWIVWIVTAAGTLGAFWLEARHARATGAESWNA